MKLVYISGPYSALTEWKTEQNIHKAENLGIQVWQSGMVAIVPHLNTKHWGGIVSYDQFLEGDFEIVKRCDAVLMVEGWEDSTGAKAEKWQAEYHNIPVFYNLVELTKWKMKKD